MYNVYLPRLRRGRDCAREYELGTSAQKCNRNHSENIKISNLQIIEHLKMLCYDQGFGARANCLLPFLSELDLISPSLNWSRRKQRNINFNQNYA